MMNDTITLVESAFRADVVRGLSSDQKYLLPKYFYDAAGDKLFQQIMHCHEYYLTRAEEEILRNKSKEILRAGRIVHSSFDIVELGAGDAAKSVYLLKEAIRMKCSEHYFPIDISANTIDLLAATLPQQLEGMEVRGLNGEYFPMLKQVQRERKQPKLVLFLGATIGNMLPAEAVHFCQQLHRFLNPNDLLLIGFDLKKNPQTILNAYNDSAGLTREFNFNLLHRINRELGADFNTDRFIHYPVYDPVTGSCKSYLISTCSQQVTLDEDTVFHFDKDEPVYMEVSQKYSADQIDEMAAQAGYETVQHFFDRQHQFVDVLWRVPSL